MQATSQKRFAPKCGMHQRQAATLATSLQSEFLEISDKSTDRTVLSLLIPPPGDRLAGVGSVRPILYRWPLSRVRSYSGTCTTTRSLRARCGIYGAARWAGASLCGGKRASPQVQAGGLIAVNIASDSCPRRPPLSGHLTVTPP